MSYSQTTKNYKIAPGPIFILSLLLSPSPAPPPEIHLVGASPNPPRWPHQWKSAAEEVAASGSASVRRHEAGGGDATAANPLLDPATAMPTKTTPRCRWIPRRRARSRWTTLRARRGEEGEREGAGARRDGVHGTGIRGEKQQQQHKIYGKAEGECRTTVWVVEVGWAAARRELGRWRLGRGGAGCCGSDGALLELEDLRMTGGPIIIFP